MEWTAGKLGNDADQYEVTDGNGRTLAVTHDDEGGKRARLFAAAPQLLAFVQKWRDTVLGGDSVASLEGWARELVREADAVTYEAAGT
jgi:hypothetical protein